MRAVKFLRLHHAHMLLVVYSNIHQLINLYN